MNEVVHFSYNSKAHVTNLKSPFILTTLGNCQQKKIAFAFKNLPFGSFNSLYGFISDDKALTQFQLPLNLANVQMFSTK